MELRKVEVITTWDAKSGLLFLSTAISAVLTAVGTEEEIIRDWAVIPSMFSIVISIYAKTGPPNNLNTLDIYPYLFLG